MPNWFWLISLAVYGSCIGSFLNVVIYRLPEGKGIVTPRSRCPKCRHALAWYDNVPVLGWLWLRGSCRYCKNPISVQYPLVEALTALLFAGLFAAYYMTPLRPEFSEHGLPGTWPILIFHLLLLAGLIASTVIDAKLFIIPRQIPWALTLIALIGLPVSVWLSSHLFIKGLVPIARPAGITTAAGGLLGLGLSMLLLWLKVLPLSFADYDQAYQAHQKEHGPIPGTAPGTAPGAAPGAGAEGEAEAWFHYPHARREVLKEVLFLAPPIVGMLLGYCLAPTEMTPWPTWLYVLGGVALGYLLGAGLVWGTRILGTLLFGKEAMGLGDVHLLAAIGAILGPGETVPVFFIAPFFGLTAVLGTIGLSAVLKKRFQPIPYGPYLAGAAGVVMVFRQPIVGFLEPLFQIFDILFVV